LTRIYLSLALLCCFTGYSQIDISGIVINGTTNLPIQNVEVLATNTSTKTTTDNKGRFSIVQSDQIAFSKKGYTTVYRILDKNKNATNVPVFIKLYPITDLDEVLLKNDTKSHLHTTTTSAISNISAHDINKANATELHPILNRVSGVFMQNATLNTNRIAIRGIGARNLFGTANIRAYFGDIPLTDGNGESAIEDFELGALSHIEIQKGPASTPYGVSLGGTILMKPAYNFTKENQGQIFTTIGSYGLHKILAKASIGNERSSLNLLYSNTHTDGYRQNNEYDRNTITLTGSIDTGERNNFSIFGSFIDLKAGIPSSLNQEDFDSSPRQAAFTWGRAQAFEDVAYAILGITWRHTYTPKITQNTSIFGSLRDNFEPRPFNILEENSNTLGIRSRILGSHDVANKELLWSAGGELFYDNYNSKTFENLFEDFPTGTGSVQGVSLSDLDEKRYYYNIFAEAAYQASDKLKFTLGMHLNQTFFDINDQFLSDGEDNSGSFEFDPIFSPKAGMNYELKRSLSIYATVAHGFSTPTTAETLLPDGIFNPDIKPEIGWNYEIGLRYSLLQNLIYGTISAYSLRVQDLLVSRRTVDDNFFAINAGKTTHNGLEIDLTVDLIKKNAMALRLLGNASIYDHTFDEFIDLDNDFSGNDLTGVPTQVLNLGLDYTSKKGFYGNLNFQNVGEIPANDANTAFGETYELLHAKIGFKNILGKRLSYDLSLGANNILDTQYASQIQINARSFGGNAPRYFYPGLPFNMYGGINLRYRF